MFTLYFQIKILGKYFKLTYPAHLRHMLFLSRSMGSKNIEMPGTNAKYRERISMNSEKTWLTCREAASLLNFTQRHIVNLIKKGKIRAEKDEDGKYYIQKSEFFRVYPQTMTQEEPGTTENSLEQGGKKFLEEKINHLQEILKERKEYNEFLTGQLQSFTQEKSKMLDAINGHTRLLEFKENKNYKPENNENTGEKKSIRFNWRKLLRID